MQATCAVARIALKIREAGLAASAFSRAQNAFFDIIGNQWLRCKAISLASTSVARDGSTWGTGRLIVLNRHIPEW
jgi:hypothetical protein